MTDHFGQRVRAIMERRGVSVETLAERHWIAIGPSRDAHPHDIRQSIDRALAGSAPPDWDWAAFIAFADALDVSLDELFGRQRSDASDEQVEALLEEYGDACSEAEYESVNGSDATFAAADAKRTASHEKLVTMFKRGSR